MIHYCRPELSLYGRTDISWYYNPCRICTGGGGGLSAVYHHNQVTLFSEDIRQTTSKLYIVWRLFLKEQPPTIMSVQYSESVWIVNIFETHGGCKCDNIDFLLMIHRS